MERRTAVKQVALLASGLMTLPAWATAWTKASVTGSNTLLTATEADTLTELIDTLIPASDTPGAKALNVPDFVQKMIADCYESAVQQNVKAGLAATDAVANASFAKSFTACDTPQRLDVLRQLQVSPDPTRKEFYSLIKNLTIQGYTTSEYVMTKYLNHTMIPGHYYGCVPAPVAAK
ncbi:gluconate 2-dehydrogenase subunit 3 family protein [Fibrella aquatica]|uniref:gluconate 2-dehydrogenase subunit 3 family protein n=1 Tax=Fibrella aquatica TaxID=3242487 RepID=UPI0035215D5F